ncbi:DGQHR domain-containing protein [Clostridium botulinum]|uniref:DGQHR domain-containing protein n=1 Tax=Clostridium botulinum TaxID=1491 RepID=UPI00077359B5|nr:DGQHR domain-containing protein [Clostridium botulinum]
MTNWDKIVTGKELVKARNLRKNRFIENRDRKVALQELESEGWEYVKNYADPKFIKVRKEKPYDQQFEDKIWLLFAQMGFTHLNTDRNFKMTYDFQNPDFTQQIDVFAADDETILIIECKSAEKIKDGVFKKNIEALHSQMDGLRKEALKHFPKRKVKFIWATQNYIMSKTDLKKMEEWGIVYFSDSIIQYYSELVKHLGTCARYQLLGSLLANLEIKNMQAEIPAIKGTMGGYDYYSFSIEPEKLLKIGYVLHRNEANKNMMPTYQRVIKKKRLKEVQSFINSGGYFPNSVIISIDTIGKGIRFDISSTRVEGSLSKLGILHLPKRYHSAYIIDGQHRLYGYSDTEYASKNTIPVVAFIDLKRKEQLQLFMDINENQKAVSKTLRLTLNRDMLWDSPNFNEQREALRSKIAQMCGEESTSPLRGRIVIGEDEKNQTKCITIQAIQAALKKSDFFTTYTKNNTILIDGSFDLGDNQNTCDLFYPFLEGCFKYIKNHSISEWSLGEAGILTINRGIQGIIRVVNDIVNHLITQDKINVKGESIDSIINEVEYYLGPLTNYFNVITDEEKKDLKGFLGGGADNKFWRAFQKAIADKCTDFIPEGLETYIENETKQYNSESREYLASIEMNLKEKLSNALEEYYGENWIIKGIPKSVYKRAKSESDERNYENISKGENIDSVTEWECITFAECRDIIIYSHNWSEIFENIVTRPEEKELLGGKEAKTEWISILSKESNRLMKASYSVSKSMFEMIGNIFAWLEKDN